MRRSVVWIVALLVVTGCAAPRPTNPSYSPDKASEANAELGVTYLQRGMLDQAKLKLEKAMRQNPDNAVAIGGYAMLLARLRRPEEAEEHFKRALQKDPDSSDILNNYGTFLCENDRLDEARDSFLRAAENPLYRTPEFAYANLGTCLTEAGDIDDAELQYMAALQSNAAFAPALYRLAEINYAKPEPRIAAAYIERYHQAARQSAESLWLAIRIYRMLDDRSQIASYSLKLRARFPESRQAAMLTESDRSE